MRKRSRHSAGKARTTPSGVKAGIITVDPYNQGGIRTHMSIVYDMLKRWGADTELYYTLIQPPLPGHKTLMGLRPNHVNRLEMDAFVMPRYPIPFAWTITPLLFGSRRLRHYDIRIAVTGSAHVAFPLAVRRLPFIAWIACVWEDELRSQVANNDPHAERLLNHPLWRLLKQQEKFVLRRARYVITNSFYTMRQVKRLVPDIADRVFPLIIPVDTDFFRPDEDNLAPDDGYLLWVARVNDPRKDFATALRAFARIREHFPDLRLIVVSEQPDQAVLALLDSCGLKQSVVFEGSVSKERLRSLYQRAQLFVLSSRQEGLGQVILEAMACGTPVVSTRSGGPNDLLDNRTDLGRLVPVGDAGTFADAAVDLLRDPQQLKAMGARCREFINAHYATHVVEAQLQDKIAEVFPRVSEALFSRHTVI